MTKPDLASLKWIREQLQSTEEYKEIYVKQIDDKVVGFAFIAKGLMFAFNTGIRNAKTLIQEIEVIKAHIKSIEVNFEY